MLIEPVIRRTKYSNVPVLDLSKASLIVASMVSNNKIVDYLALDKLKDSSTKAYFVELEGGIRNNVFRLLLRSKDKAYRSLIVKNYADISEIDRSMPVEIVKRGQLEFNALSYIQLSICPNTGVEVPTPICFIENINCLFMEDVRNADTSLYSTGIEKVDHSCIVPGKIGRWLRVLHGSFSEKISSETASRRNNHSRLMEFQFRQAREACGQLNFPLTRIESLSLSQSTLNVILHGDFCTKNIFVHGKERITVLDLETCTLGDPAYDIGFMLAHFIIDYYRGFTDTGFLINAWKRFLQGYGDISDQTSNNVANWCGLMLLYRSKTLGFLGIIEQSSLVSNLKSTGLQLLRLNNFDFQKLLQLSGEFRELSHHRGFSI